MKKFSYFNAFFVAVLIVSVYRNLFCNKFVSHKNEPKIGDRIKNNNSSCKHYKSMGTVIDIENMEHDIGKIIVYKVENTGKNFGKGQILHKTMDQVISM